MQYSDIKVLLCDDSVFARKKICSFFTEMGIDKIYEASDGIQAVEMYKKYKPDLVFMDIIMPKLEGTQAVKQIVAFNPEAKVVMASSVGTQNYLKDAINAGAYEFLQKPIEKELVIKIVENLFKED